MPGQSGRPASAAAFQRAAPVYAANCVSCHGPEGRGDPLQGAPNLTDREWLYGSTRADIQAQIHNGRGGVMPPWSGRLDPETVKDPAVYAHANAVGQGARRLTTAPATTRPGPHAGRPPRAAETSHPPG